MVKQGLAAIVVVSFGCLVGCRGTVSESSSPGRYVQAIALPPSRSVNADGGNQTYRDHVFVRETADGSRHAIQIDDADRDELLSGPVAFEDLTEYITLSPAAPRHDESGVELLRLGRDGSALIEFRGRQGWLKSGDPLPGLAGGGSYVLKIGRASKTVVIARRIVHVVLLDSKNSS